MLSFDQLVRIWQIIFYSIKVNRSGDGNRTLNENLADNLGMRHSYKAYQIWQRTHKREALLPGFETLTPNQLFFLSFANVRFINTYIYFNHSCFNLF